MKSRSLVWGAALLVIGALNCAGCAPRATRNPDLATMPVARAPYDLEAVRRALLFAAKQVRYDPQSAIYQASLANCYLDSYRETGDGADVSRAERAARASIKLRSSNNGQAYYSLSRALVAQHRFQEALAAAQQAARYDRSAFRQCADTLLEIGDYDAARRDLARAPVVENDPAYLALQARLLEIEGDNTGARQLMERAATLAQNNLEESPQNIAWFWERLGHIQAQSGQGDEAKTSYTRALDVFPPDHRAMAALSRLHAARGDWKGCLLWGERAAAMVPAPDTIALLGEAHEALGQPKVAAQKYALVRAMERIARAQGVTFDRQLALFYANRRQNLPLALEMAQGELKVRHDIYAHDTLAWILFQMGRFSEAQRASDLSLRRKTGDAMLWYHAGLIADARGQKARARASLERALQLNPDFLTPKHPNRARAILARL